MKKLIVFVLVLSCVIGIVGCNNSRPVYVEPNYTSKEVIAGKSYSDVDGISVYASGICIYPDITTMVINWHNKTEHSAYSESYWFERFENGEWVSCSLKDNVFTESTHELRAEKWDSKEYTLTDKYDVSKPGTYRFLSTCSVEKGDGETTDCSVWVEFIIE